VIEPGSEPGSCSPWLESGMHALLSPHESFLALVVRALVVYAFLLVALRISGRRELGQMTSFDLVLLLVISNAVQNAINAGDNSLVGGIVSAVTLLLLNWAMGWASYRWGWAERLLQGRPLRIVSDGKVHFGALRRELITLSELRSALRKQGIARIGDCAAVILEPDGTLSVRRKGVEQASPAELAHPESFGDAC
jgi:uncharacterized membrane protein YcaP (DUF421 family)